MFDEKSLVVFSGALHAWGVQQPEHPDRVHGQIFHGQERAFLVHCPVKKLESWVKKMIV